MPHTLQDYIAHIHPIPQDLAAQAQQHLDNLTKPQGSLGLLEELAKRLYCIQGGSPKIRATTAHMFTVAGDHGIVVEGVASFPQEVTRQMVLNFLNGGAAINVLCRNNNIAFSVVDAGCVGGPFPAHEKLIDMRLGEGTKNFAAEAAMSREACIEALCNGIKLAESASKEGYSTVGIGEMGISNTTSATALFCAIYGLKPEHITGPGAGASASLIAHKAQVIERALALHAPALQQGDPIDTLALLGGFEIASMAGIALGAAKNGLILMVDGFISTAAFAAAQNICSHVQDYAILSHFSAEPGYISILESMKKHGCHALPLLQLQMRLGEGTGAALAIPLVRSAAAIFNEMATFSSAQVSGGN